MKKERILAFICLVILLPCFAIPSSANSAQQEWRGIDASGALITSGDSPIVVENELLTFDISEFPESYYPEEADFLAYSPTVTAQYSFYNPSDMTVTATLAFPFGRSPDYGYGYDSFDAEKYSITLNGENVEKQVRHTLAYAYSDFSLENDLPLLFDEYISDDFYSPDLCVTLYKYEIDKIETGEYYRALNFAFDIAPDADSDRIYYMPCQSGFHTQDNGDVRVSAWAERNTDFALYVFGEPLDGDIDWKFYQDGGVEDGEEVAGSISLVNTLTMRFEDFALMGRSEDSEVSKVDWYNAVIADLRSSSSKSRDDVPLVFASAYQSGFANSLMRWYQYEITLAPKERIVNTVTAPIYPGIDLTYTSPAYDYTYLLSPAASWSDFGRLEIVINTPYYIIDSNLDGFEKNDEGYSLILDGLPKDEDGNYTELRFVLSADENSIPKSKTAEGIIGNILLYLILYLPVILGVLLIIAIILIVKKFVFRR